MMIRINLLPTRAAKKRESNRQSLVVAAGLVLIALVGNWFWYSSRSDVAAEGKRRIGQLNTEIAAQDKIIGEVSQINSRRTEILGKLEVLDTLRKGRTGPVRLIDALATATPKKVWLTGFAEKSDRIKLDGQATSHEEVAEFMRSLSTVVWTPKGLGRLVEQRRDATTSRVELATPDAPVEEFPVSEVKFFFRDVQLARSQQGDGKNAAATASINFSLNMASTYAL